MTKESRDRDRHDGFLRPGRNCWRLARADRAALLVDGEAYFSALRQAAALARHSLFIVGWDIDSRTVLARGAEDDGLPRALGEFLDALVARNRELHVHILEWDFALLYALDREVLPLYNRRWRTHGRLHFHLDDCHPPGGSHHQKLVVVDDVLAFVGGIDLTRARWDTPEHAPDDPRRRAPGGEPYAPFHDVQLMVEGEAAAALGEVARARWRRATGREPQATGDLGARLLWPATVTPDFDAVDIAIARTEPAWEGSAATQEILRLYLDGIGAARHWIYIENQYFTAPAIGSAIEARLAEADGPEVVIVTRRRGGGWLEQATMELLRARLVKRLEPKDVWGRLRVVCPEQAGLDDQCIDLHSKLMIVDDWLLRVGSANLNNRSMGIDTECDVAIVAKRPAQAAAIAAIRNRLLGEHLGVEAQVVARAIERQGSLIAAIDALQGNARTLRPLEPELDPQLDALVPDAETIDPERPVNPARLVDEVVPEDDRPRARRHVLGIALALAAAAALAAAWRWGPLHEWLDPGTLRAVSSAIEGSRWAPVWMLAVYVAASLMVIPISLLVVATAIVFDPWMTVVYALAGSVLGAGVTFAIGKALGRRAVRRLAGRRLNALSRRLGEGGVPAVVVLRMLPVAPFTVVNLVAGASHLRMRDFLIGTALGMTPGVVAVAVFADRLAAVLEDPTPGTIALLVLVLVTVGAAALGIDRWLRRRTRRQDGGRG